MLFKRSMQMVYQMSYRNISYVQRARLLEKIKNDQSICQEHMKKGKFLLYHKGKPLLKRTEGQSLTPQFVDHDYCSQVSGDDLTNTAVLSVNEDGDAVFAAGVTNDDTTDVEVTTTAKFTDLRMGLFMVDQSTAHQLSKGWSLLTWRRNNQFCTKCGSRVNINVSGSGAVCSNSNCGHQTYPSTSPVGIVSVTDESNDNILLIRQPRYPPGMYSCIAGFVDSGESIEDCVKREVAEEVGLEISSVKYRSSQHWPFPAGSIMIGCEATVPGVCPTADPCQVELEDARWFTREEIQVMVSRINENPRLRLGRGNSPDHLFVTPRGAIAHHLITAWLHEK